jgi:hypothetical protein
MSVKPNTKARAGRRSLHQFCSARVSVCLAAYDWHDLANFVRGDLANMNQEDEVARQMARIIETIMVACAKAPNDRTLRPEQERKDYGKH